MNPGQPPPSKRQEDGVIQGHNSSAANGTAPGGAAIGEEELRDEGELRLSEGKRTKRAKRARVKRGMRSSCGRTRRWQDNLLSKLN